MRNVKEDSSFSSDQIIDIFSAVEELSGLSCRELNVFLKDSDNFTIQLNTVKGSSRQIDVERLASALPLHLIAVLLSSDVDIHLTHLLHGVRLLHTLSELATRQPRLEQMLLDDVKLSEQMLDLVFYMLIILARCEQGNFLGTSIPFLHSSLVACTFYLLPGYISSQWHELVHALLAHPKVDIFMDIAYDAVHVDIRFLHIELSALDSDVMHNKLSLAAAERICHYLCQQCEASLQFLHSLCQQKMFRDRLLRNKELCKNGGILSLANSILKISTPDCFKESFGVVTTVSRMKSKVLSILLQLCEAENISYLDEVASSSNSMHLAKQVALKILDLLKTAFKKETKGPGGSLHGSFPKGLVLLNSLRLADIFSDDSNFRSFFMTNTIEVLVEILAIPHEEFLSNWCSVDIPTTEEDANIDYDPFTSAGVALVSFSGRCENALSTPFPLSETNSACNSSSNGIPSVTYAQQISAYLVKVIANLHCYIPNICEEEERNLFLNKFHECLLVDTPGSVSRSISSSDFLKGATICKNLSSLSSYASSLIPILVNDDDVQLLRLFSDQLQKLIPWKISDNSIEESFPRCGVLENEAGRNRMQQCLLNWIKPPDSNFTKTHQNTESSGGDAASILTKLDASAEEEPYNFKDNVVDIKRESPQNSLGQEFNQLIIQSKIHGLSDDFEHTQNKGKNVLTPSRSGSLRGIENENQNSKVEIELIEHEKESSFREDDRAGYNQGEEKHPRKRKRNIMNERQVILIENALLDEPEMQRNASLLQLWADKLSTQGSEVTTSQLKNWLNNRKARLARAAREARASSEGDCTYLEKSNTSHYYDSADSGGEYYIPPSRGSAQSVPKIRGVVTRAASAEDQEMTSTDFPDFVAHTNRTSVVAALPCQLSSPQLLSPEGNPVGKKG